MQKQQFPILMTFGHLCADLNQGVLAAILPFLVAAYHYDLSLIHISEPTRPY